MVVDDSTYTSRGDADSPWEIVSEIKAGGRSRGRLHLFALDEGTVRDSEHTTERSLLDGVTRVLSEAIERSEAQAKVIQASKLASIGELAAGVGHEINNPVNGIINCADIILKQAQPGSSIHQFGTLIRSEAERIANIVHNLLTFSRQDKQQHSLASLGDIVTSVLSLCHKRLEKSHIQLSVDVPADLPRLYCRSEQIQQVLMNLIINAMHALDEKYPDTNSNKTMRLYARSHIVSGRQGVRITVEDCGTGMTEAHRQRMFDPFFTTKGRDKGTGLGLSISDGIVKAHNGVIECETEVGAFTRIHVDLPLRPSEPTITERGTATSGSGEPSGGSRRG